MEPNKMEHSTTGPTQVPAAAPTAVPTASAVDTATPATTDKPIGQSGFVGAEDRVAGADLSGGSGPIGRADLGGLEDELGPAGRVEPVARTAPVGLQDPSGLSGLMAPTGTRSSEAPIGLQAAEAPVHQFAQTSHVDPVGPQIPKDSIGSEGPVGSVGPAGPVAAAPAYQAPLGAAGSSSQDQGAPSEYDVPSETTGSTVGGGSSIVEPDDSAMSDTDSGYGGHDGDVSSFTTSLRSIVTDYQLENSRRYHAYKKGAYPFPNDDSEQERLDIKNEAYRLLFRSKLHLCPLTPNPQAILDLGTGTGLWAIEMAEMYPGALVIGNDLSPIQPSWVPPNCKFEVDDIEQPWSYEEKFDLIHTRHLDFGLKDWKGLVERCFEHTKPGGWSEFQESDYNWHSQDDSFKPDNKIATWSATLQEICRAGGREPCPGPILEPLLRQAGFVNITHRIIPCPIGPWARDKRLKDIGAYELLNVLEGIEGFSMALFTRYRGYSKEEVQVMIGEVRRELMDPRIHSLVTMHVVYGQKPKEGVREEEVEESGLIEVDSEMGGMEPASGGEVGKGKGVEVSAGGPTAPA